MKRWKKIFVLLIIIFIGIQFFRPEKNQATQVLPTDISKVYGTPEDVQTILSKACNDCHSNHSVYPWYFNIQPVAWWMTNHINDGKNNINFSEFGSYRIAKQYKRMQDCINEVKHGDMPLNSYTWIHKNAILTDQEKQKIYDWCTAIRDSIKAKYPADSLKMPERKQEED